MASAGIYGLIRHFTNWRRQRASEQAQGVGNIVPRHAHRVIEFYIPDNYKNKVWHRGRIYGTSEVSPRSKQLGWRRPMNRRNLKGVQFDRIAQANRSLLIFALAT